MSSRSLYTVSAVIMGLLGGALVGGALKPTPVGGFVQGNELILFGIGALIGVLIWLVITLITLALCSEMLFVQLGNGRVESLIYMLSALLVGNAGDWITVDKGQSKVIKKRGPLASLSNPGVVIINHGSAAVFEQFGRQSRVGFKGLLRTKPLEVLRAAVDLSPQYRQKQISLFTKDGIPLQAEVQVYFQIHSGGHKPTPGNMYPAIEQAVLNAVYTVPDWREYTIETAVALLRSMIATYYLYEIYDPLKRLMPENQEPRAELGTLRNDLHNSLDQVTFNWGVKIQNLTIAIRPPKEIEDQALAFEKTRMEIETSRTENTRIKEFIEQTGGTVTEYALLQFCQKAGKTGAIPASVDQWLSDILEKATVRMSRRQERQTAQTPTTKSE